MADLQRGNICCPSQYFFILTRLTSALARACDASVDGTCASACRSAAAEANSDAQDGDRATESAPAQRAQPFWLALSGCH